MKCHVCGVDIPEGATHCPDCGTIIEVTEQGGAPAPGVGQEQAPSQGVFPPAAPAPVVVCERPGL